MSMLFHIGDRGSQFLITLTNSQTKLPEDISTASIIKFSWLKPDKTTVSKDGALASGGLDGKVQYTVTDESFFDQKGKWKMQVYVELTGGQWYSTKDEFTVDDNIVNHH